MYQKRHLASADGRIVRWGQYNVWELTPVTESDSAISMKQESVLYWLPILCKGGEYETFQDNKTFTSHQYRRENRTHAERG